MLTDLLFNRAYKVGAGGKFVKQDEELNAIEEQIYSNWGLVREWNDDGTREELSDFVDRARNTVFNKEKPLNWVPKNERNKILKNIGKHAKTTKRIQGISKKFFGVDQEPLDAFMCDLEGAGGVHISEPDGSGVIGMGRGAEEDYHDDIRRFAGDLKKYFNDEGFKLRYKKLSLIGLFAGKTNHQGIERSLFQNWLADIYNNFDYMAAHEAVHNLDGNARPTETKEIIELMKEDTSKLRLAPFLRHLSMFKLVQYSVDRETTAFKVSTDAYIQQSFRDVRILLGCLSPENNEKLNNLEESFYEMSSSFSKKMVQGAYLKKKNLGGIIDTAVKIGINVGLYSFLDQDQVDGVLSFMSQAAAYYSLGEAIVQVIDAPAKLSSYYYFKHKTNQYVDAWHSVLRAEGIKKGIKDTLGMTPDARVKAVKDTKSYQTQTPINSAILN